MRFGRQYVFELHLDEGLDGLLINMDMAPYFSVLVFGGKPVSLDEIDSGSGDAISSVITCESDSSVTPMYI